MSKYYLDLLRSNFVRRGHTLTFLSALCIVAMSTVLLSSFNHRDEMTSDGKVTSSLSTADEAMNIALMTGHSTTAMSGSGSLLLTKMATYQDNDASGTVNIGDSILFMFTVENTGTETVDKVVVIDPLVGGLFVGTDFSGPFTGSGVNYGSPSSYNGSPFFIGSGSPIFMPMDSGSMKFRYPISSADIENGYVFNSATTEGDCNGEPIVAQGSITLKLPYISLISITDPCNCDDPRNTQQGIDYYFHEKVVISSYPGESWTLGAGSIGIYDPSGVPLSAVSINEILPGSGIYEMDFWVLIGEAYTLEATNSIITETVSGLCNEACDCDPTAPAPSLACPGKINMTLGPNCYATYDPRDISMANGVRLVMEFFDKSTGRSLGDTLYKEHLGLQIGYNAKDTCANTFCWGDINLELKLEPQTETSKVFVMCGETYPDLLTLAQLDSVYNGRCFAPLSGFREYIRTVGDKCDTVLVLRTVLADSHIEDRKRTITLRIDTIAELPIAINMITCPLGTGTLENALELECSSLDGYPTPAKIEELAGINAAYPHVDKGEVISSRNVLRQVITERVERRELTVNGVTGIYNVVVKDTSIQIAQVFDTARVYLPLKDGQTCNLAIKYFDENFVSCTGPGNKIKRTWTILNWCSGVFEECEQWISITDKTPPVIKPTEDVYVTAEPWTCRAEAQLPGSATDNCTDVRYKWSVSHGAVDSTGKLTGIDLAQGKVTVELQAIDACGNIARDTFFVFIVDRSAPVAVSKDRIFATIIPGGIDGGTVKVTVDAIDAGSHDSECGDFTRCLILPEEWDNPIIDPQTGVQAVDADGHPLYRASQCEYDGIFEALTIVRKDTTRENIPYVICKDFVKFCCADIGTQRVMLIVNDESSYSPPGIGWTDVVVENKLAPVVTCPSPITVSCGQDYEIPRPTVIDGPCSSEGLEYTLLEDINSCGAGKIDVIWTYDGKVLCRSVINVVNDKGFDPSTIRWPLHYTGESLPGIVRECVVTGKDARGNDIYGIQEKNDFIVQNDPLTCVGTVNDEPVWCDTYCSLAIMGYEDEEVADSDACKKIIRRWTIIDWCNYKPNQGGTPEDNNDGSETFELVDDLWITPDSKCEDCEKFSGERKSVYFRYKNYDKDGFYTFDQIIKIVDDTPPSIFAPEVVDVDIVTGAVSKDDDFDDCKSSSIVSATVADLCGEAEIDPSSITWSIRVVSTDGTLIAGPKSARGATATMTTGVGGIKDVYYINWLAEDACGNKATLQTTVNFVDRWKPTPVCKASLSTATMNTDGTATIWAEDFNNGSYDNCSEIKIFFKNATGLAVSSLIFTCADIPNGRTTIKDLRLFVADEAGNEEYCLVKLRIDDNSDVCPDVETGAALIAGELRTEGGQMIERAEVRLDNDRVELTTVEGEYAFEELITDIRYEVNSYKNDNHLNGVSTLDLVQIQRHILGNKLLDNPYKVIAADVNADQRVSAIDLVEMRQLILGVITEFRKNTSWRFVDAKQTFSNANRPWPFTERISIDPLTDNMMGQDFIGVKVGDVSGNAIANSALKAKNRTSRNLSFEVSDQLLKVGETVSVHVLTSNLSDIAAFQWTFETKDIEILGIESGEIQMNEDNFAKINNATTTLAWYTPIAFSSSGRAFTLLLRAKKDVLLSKALSIGSTVTAAVAYSGDEEELGIEWSYTKDAESIWVTDLSLGQNTPNPFGNETIIPFTLTQDGEVTLTITDLTGKLLFKHRSYRDKGENTLRINRNDLSATGMLYYHLEAEGKRISQKMLRIE